MDWFVGYVKSCQERMTAKALEQMGIHYYLPIQKVPRKWSDRVKIIDKMVIPGIIFVYCSEQERRKTLTEIPPLYAYIMDRGTKKPARVPSEEMEAFRFMVEHSGETVNFSQEILSPGDKVRVTSGPMSGMKCEYLGEGGSGLAIVRLSLLGAATVKILRSEVTRLEDVADE